MNTYEKLIEDAEVKCMPWKAEIVRCAKAYTDADDAVRENRCGYLSVRSPDTPEWKEYLMLQDVYDKAMAALWMATDVEYDDKDEIAAAAWEWRFWKVIARKCCYYQKRYGCMDDKAANTMRCLQDAETNLMRVCGLDNSYKSSNYYLEKMFPKLKA